MSRLLGPLLVEKEGFGGLPMRFHPSHDMGSLHCRRCYAHGIETGEWRRDRDHMRARRPCPLPLNPEGVGL